MGPPMTRIRSCLRIPPSLRALSPLLWTLPLLLLAVSGCQKKGIEQIAREELFSLSLGRLDDQIDLFQHEGAVPGGTNRIAMRDGQFYIANGNAGKIMIFTSYGDLIFLLYNPKTNPAPVLLGQAGSADTVSTRGSVSYPFADLGEIAVASDKRIYVEDSVPRAKAVRDAARGTLADRVVLRFDRKGRAEGFIGQEGLGGAPFPFISAMHVTDRDHLVVVCRVPDSWLVFWYSREGALLYQVEIDGAHLPAADEKNLIPSLAGIMPDMQEPVLHLLIHSYRQTVDESTKTQSSVELVSSCVWKLDLRTRGYTSFIELPRNAPRKEKVGLKTTEVPAPPNDLLGVGSNGYFYVLGFADPNLYRLQVLDPSGRVRAQRYMIIEDSELTYRDLRFSPTGIVYGLLADQTKAHVSWWRSDLVLKGE